MQFKDAFRAQYFINTLERKITEFSNSISHLSIFSSSFEDSIITFVEKLSIELDQIILPTISFEIFNAKNKGLLNGDTPKERYENFFVRNGKFSDQAFSLIDNYPFLFEMLDNLIETSFHNLKECLVRFSADMLFLEKEFNQVPIRIKHIEIIGASDRHRNRQTLLVICTNNLRIIYKPTDLKPDALFASYVQNLNLPFPFNIRCMKVFPKNEYGWIEFIDHVSCLDESEIKDFYRRAGVLLAISDALNYTDGHCENLIASRCFPILLDGETFFQNYAMDVVVKKNILSTSLIQKTSDLEKDRIPYSAFQSLSTEKREILYTYAENDRSDDLRVRFQGIRKNINQNCPHLFEKCFTAGDYIEEMIEGFSFAYDLISKNAFYFLSDRSWWAELASIRSRSVIRETSAYVYLLRQIQQPIHCKSKLLAENFIRGKLFDSPYLAYELEDLLKLNVPYFYHLPGERHLFNGNDECYNNAFHDNAVSMIKDQFLKRSDQKKKFDCAILRKHLSVHHELNREKFLNREVPNIGDSYASASA